MKLPRLLIVNFSTWIIPVEELWRMHVKSANNKQNNPNQSANRVHNLGPICKRQRISVSPYNSGKPKVLNTNNFCNVFILLTIHNRNCLFSRITTTLLLLFKTDYVIHEIDQSYSA